MMRTKDFKKFNMIVGGKWCYVGREIRKSKKT